MSHLLSSTDGPPHAIMHFSLCLCPMVEPPDARTHLSYLFCCVPLLGHRVRGHVSHRLLFPMAGPQGARIYFSLFLCAFVWPWGARTHFPTCVYLALGPQGARTQCSFFLFAVASQVARTHFSLCRVLLLCHQARGRISHCMSCPAVGPPGARTRVSLIPCHIAGPQRARTHFTSFCVTGRGTCVLLFGHRSRGRIPYYFVCSTYRPPGAMIHLLIVVLSLCRGIGREDAVLIALCVVLLCAWVQSTYLLSVFLCVCVSCCFVTRCEDALLIVFVS